MRLGVLDVGSNTVHLLVVDAHRGGHPIPTFSEKSELRLAELLRPDGALSRRGEDRLIEAICAARESAEHYGTEDLVAFATSAVRDATNSESVLARVRAETGVALAVLTGPDEARMTFLAVRRWLGWSAGRLLVLDIGGGSLEIAGGIDEEPDVALSLPLGAGRLTRERLSGDPPRGKEVAALRQHVRTALAPLGPVLVEFGAPDRAVATSKTFRSLARLGTLDGVSPSRAHQLLAGAVVAESAMAVFGVAAVEICPWALREGVILQRLDWLHSACAGSQSGAEQGSRDDGDPGRAPVGMLTSGDDHGIQQVRT